MMRKLRVMSWEVMALSLVFSLNASAATLARQSGAVGVVTCDLAPVPSMPVLARQSGAVGIVTYDPAEIVIDSVDDWNAFCAAVADGAATEGKVVRLACDIGPVATMAGTSAHPFAGVFDGGSNTLTVALSGAGECVAPFARIAGATIRDLRVAGTVAGGMHCSGLVGAVDGGAANLVEGCEVAAAISCSRTHFGGFVGHGVTNAATLRGCVFSGSLSGGTCVATFHGWSDGGATTLIDCLDASASPHPIGRGVDAACVSNTYYLVSKDFSNGERLWSEGKRGVRAFVVSPGDGVELGFGEPILAYGGSDLAVHPAGLAHAGSFYAEAGASVGLSAVFEGTPPAGKKHDAFQASAGDFAGSGDAWELAMPAGDVVVSATFADVTAYEIWAAANGVEGAWDAKDIGDVYNVFRYAFDDTNAVPDPPLLDIAIEGGNAVVKTPPVANTEGFTVSVVESSDIAGKTVTRRRTPDATGRAVFAMEGADSRFYRLAAAELGGVQLWEGGPYWAECNVGASTPEEYGYYFWWGDTVGYVNDGRRSPNGNYHEVTWTLSTGEQLDDGYPPLRPPTYGKDNAALLAEGYIDATGNLAAAHDAATANLGSPWRMPTYTEMFALHDNCDATWITTNGVPGELFTGRGDYAGRSIFLPAAGYGSPSRLCYPDSQVCVWSSTPGASDDAWLFRFYGGGWGYVDEYRNKVIPVRPVRDPTD